MLFLVIDAVRLEFVGELESIVNSMPKKPGDHFEMKK